MKTTEIQLIYKKGTAKLYMNTIEDLSEAIHDYWTIDEDVEFPSEEQLDEDNWEVVNWGEAEYYENLRDISLLNEIAKCTTYYDWDVISAAVDCDINLENIDEAYWGEHSSDENFAMNLAEDLGYIDRHVSWPYTCIDWDMAATDLMQDYCESNHHYFRIL